LSKDHYTLLLTVFCIIYTPMHTDRTKRRSKPAV